MLLSKSQFLTKLNRPNRQNGPTNVLFKLMTRCSQKKSVFERFEGNSKRMELPEGMKL